MAKSISPEQLEKARATQIRNILAKQKAGKILTRREETLLLEAAGQVEPGSGNYARNWDELASALGVSRKTLQNVRARLPGAFPKPRADGRHDVKAWADFFVQHNIDGAAEDLTPEEAAAAGVPASVTDWKAEKLRLECERIQIGNLKEAGELVARAEVESGTADMVQGFRQALDNFSGRLAQKIVGIMTFHEGREIVDHEVDILKRTLQAADFQEVNNGSSETKGAEEDAPASQRQRRQKPTKPGPSTRKKYKTKGRHKGRGE